MTLAGGQRQIGVIGIAARIAIGFALLAAGFVGGKVVVMHGRLSPGFVPLSVVVGLVAFPAVLLTAQWLRSRRTQNPIRATGPLAAVLNEVAFLALFLTPWYAPPLAFTSAAILVFLGGSMLLAAIRGYGGCEVLAASNWLLRRDDQVGCMVLSPIDNAERRYASRSSSRSHFPAP